MTIKLHYSFVAGFFLTTFNLHAHHHQHDTYIVEQPKRPYVVVQEPAPPIFAKFPVTEVESAPPAEFEEEVSPSPGTNYTWIKGHWQWNGNQWEREHGHWLVRPADSSVWVQGYWKEHHHHWIWIDGHWQ